LPGYIELQRLCGFGKVLNSSYQDKESNRRKLRHQAEESQQPEAPDEVSLLEQEIMKTTHSLELENLAPCLTIHSLLRIKKAPRN
jgi:hypothetical protein